MTVDRPLILVSIPLGDTWGHYWSRAFVRPIVDAGGLPMLLGGLEREVDRRAALRLAGGLVLAGGLDIDPVHYGAGDDDAPLWDLDPLRDELELPLVREAIESGVPLLGTCRGMQVLNVALGGTLYLDRSRNPQAPDHPSGGVPGFAALVDAYMAGAPAPAGMVRHGVTTEPGTLLRELVGPSATVNSFHHQHIRDLAPGLAATAHADDGVIEGIELEDGAAIAVGVQWEAQESWESDPGQRALFATLVEHSRRREVAQ